MIVMVTALALVAVLVTKVLASKAAMVAVFVGGGVARAHAYRLFTVTTASAATTAAYTPKR